MPVKTRQYRLVHQTLCIRRINFERQSLIGYTELTLKPTSPALRRVKLNCRQIEIFGVWLIDPAAEADSNDGLDFENDEQLTFTYNDPSQWVYREGEEVHDIDAFSRRHEERLCSVDADLDNGELVIKLSAARGAPLVSALKPFKLLIEFGLTRPTEGVYFVVPDDVDPSSTASLSEKGAHVFTAVRENLSRVWFPCIDCFGETCTWKVEITVEGDDFSAVSVGELLQVMYTEDLKGRVYHYYLAQPVSAPSIAFAVGPFEIYPDPKSSAITHFCLPKLMPLLKNTVERLPDIIEFYEETLSFRFPFPCYKTVFVDSAYEDLQSYASLSIFSVYVLHSERIIDQAMSMRRLLSHAAADQFFGQFINMSDWCNAWLVRGISGHLALSDARRTFGTSDYRVTVAEMMEQVCTFEHTTQPIVLDPSLRASVSHVRLYSPQLVSPEYIEAYVKKATLVIRMLELRIGAEVLVQVLNKALVLASSPPASDLARDEVEAGGDATRFSVLSLTSFVRIISQVTGKDIKNFVETWVAQGGHVRIVGQFIFNRKRNVVELELRQESHAKGAMRYHGPMPVTLQELDGSFQHPHKLEDIRSTFDILCHSKARKNKRKKIPLSNGDEVDMDLTRMDPDSPVLWLRVDVAMSTLRHICLLQADYMWQYMLRYERDAVGQYEAVDSLVDHPTQETRMALTEVIDDERLFYRIRVKACFALCLVSNTPLLISTFRNTFGSPSCRQLVRQNNFANLQQYFMQKAIPEALATVKNQANMCPPEIVRFVLDLLKYNDNSRNASCDSSYRASLVTALRSTLTTQLFGPTAGVSQGTLPPEARGTVDEVLHQLNMEKLMPSFRYQVTCECLATLRKLQKLGYIPVDATIFREYASKGSSFDVRVAALDAIVDLVRNERDEQELDWLLLEVIGKPDKVPRLRYECLRRLCAQPPFIRNENSPLNRADLAERIWYFLNSPLLDNRLRCSLVDLWQKLYGAKRPSCLPPLRRSGPDRSVEEEDDFGDEETTGEGGLGHELTSPMDDSGGLDLSVSPGHSPPQSSDLEPMRKRMRTSGWSDKGHSRLSDDSDMEMM